jgi:hypothetical protein
MVGVEVNPVKGLPSGFPVIMLKLPLKHIIIYKAYEGLFVMIFMIFVGVA